MTKSSSITLMQDRLQSSQCTLISRRVSISQTQKYFSSASELDTASQRRIMRTYGAEFTYLEGEPPDEPVPPPAP